MGKKFSRTTELEKETFIKLYKGGMSSKDISKITKRDTATITKVIRDAGITLRNSHYYFDNTKFDIIDDEKKAYWLGFLYADGNVSKAQNCVTLSLASLDIDHVKKYKEFLCSNHPIYIKPNGLRGKYECATLKVTNPYFKESLIKYGCTPCKSLTTKLPESLDKTLLRHFLRGMWDGDGCITIYENCTKGISTSVIGSKNIIEEIQKVIIKELQISGVIKPCGNVYTLVLYKRYEAYKLLNWLYEDSQIYLNRKLEKYKQMKKYCLSYPQKVIS